MGYGDPHPPGKPTDHTDQHRWGSIRFKLPGAIVEQASRLRDLPEFRGVVEEDVIDSESS